MVQPAQSSFRQRKKAKIVFLKERIFYMLKKDLILRNPLRLLGESSDSMLKSGEFGVVLARAGVGKTSFLVQLALDSLLNGKNVLHVSLDQPVKKVCLWYEEIFRNIAEQYHVENTHELWDAILPHRFIMTFNVGAFNVPLFEERLGDFVEQGIFFPQLAIIDGLPFGEEDRETISELKMLAREFKLPVWFTAKSHRKDKIMEDGIPSSVAHVSDLMDVIMELQFAGKDIEVKIVKGTEEIRDAKIKLDPTSFLIKH